MIRIQADKIREQTEKRKGMELWEEGKKGEEITGLNHRLNRNKAGSAGIANSNGGLSKYNSESKLPSLMSKHTTSLANFKDLQNTRSSQPHSSNRPIAPPSVFEIPQSGSLPKIGTKSALKGIGSQSTKSYSKLVRIRDQDEDKPLNEDEDFLKPCPLGCGRKFGEENLEKHIKICDKVFKGRREPFDSSKKRWAKVFKK